MGNFVYKLISLLIIIYGNGSKGIFHTFSHKKIKSYFLYKYVLMFLKNKFNINVKKN